MRLWTLLICHIKISMLIAVWYHVYFITIFPYSPENCKIVHSITVAYGCSSEPDGNTELLKIPYALTTRHEEIK